MNKDEFSASLLQSLGSHDPSEIILICCSISLSFKKKITDAKLLFSTHTHTRISQKVLVSEDKKLIATTQSDVSSYDSAADLIGWNSSHTQCSDMVSLRCESSCALSGFLSERTSCGSANTCTVSLQCESSDAVSSTWLI